MVDALREHWSSPPIVLRTGWEPLSPGEPDQGLRPGVAGMKPWLRLCDDLLLCRNDGGDPGLCRGPSWNLLRRSYCHTADLRLRSLPQRAGHRDGAAGETVLQPSVFQATAEGVRPVEDHHVIPQVF